MIFAIDIENKIKSDFGEKYLEAIQILKEAIENADYLKSDRIIRCIVFLAEKEIEKLRHNIQVAILDPRDVMYWAEYTKRTEIETAKRIRDFNKVFDLAEIEVKE